MMAAQSAVIPAKAGIQRLKNKTPGEAWGFLLLQLHAHYVHFILKKRRTRSIHEKIHLGFRLG